MKKRGLSTSISEVYDRTDMGIQNTRLSIVFCEKLRWVENRPLPSVS